MYNREERVMNEPARRRARQRCDLEAVAVRDWERLRNRFWDLSETSLSDSESRNWALLALEAEEAQRRAEARWETAERILRMPY